MADNEWIEVNDLQRMIKSDIYKECLSEIVEFIKQAEDISIQHDRPEYAAAFSLIRTQCPFKCPGERNS